MAVSFATVRDSVAAKLKRSGSVAEAHIDEQIQAAVRYCRRKPWHFTEKREGTLTTVASQDWYSSVVFGADTIDVADITRIDLITSPTNLDLRLGVVDYIDFIGLQRGSTTSSNAPTVYTRYAQQIGLWATPAAVFNLTVSAVTKPAVPATGATTSVFFEQARDLIEAYACEKVCSLYFRDQEQAAAFRGEWMGQVSALNAEHASQTATGRTMARN